MSASTLFSRRVLSPAVTAQAGRCFAQTSSSTSIARHTSLLALRSPTSTAAARRNLAAACAFGGAGRSLHTAAAEDVVSSTTSSRVQPLPTTAASRTSKEADNTSAQSDSSSATGGTTSANSVERCNLCIATAAVAFAAGVHYFSSPQEKMWRKDSKFVGC